MYMQIIIEGMDNSGKTTLCGQISHALKIPVVHTDKPNSYAEAVAQTKRVLLDSSLKVRDRINPISEMIYGPVCRGHDLWEGAQWEWIDWLMRAGCVFIHCRPPAKDILNFGDREQMDGVLEHAAKLIPQYDTMFIKLWQAYPSQVFSYDYTQTLCHTATLDNILRECESIQDAHLHRRAKVTQLVDWGRIFTTQIPSITTSQFEAKIP